MTRKSLVISIRIIIVMLLMQHIAVAQFERTIHQTLPTDSIKEIHFNLLGQLDVQPWAGNGILTETHIILENGSPQLLEQIIKQGRYLISTELKSADNLMLKHGILEKSRLRYKNNEAIERLYIRIYIPDDFVVVNKTLIRRKGD